MKRINASGMPAHDAGIFITQSLFTHLSDKILLLLSGGSSLQILGHIDTDSLGPHITIMMVDERFTKDIAGNNFTQLTKTDFYQDAKTAGVKFISSKPRKNETHSVFTKRLRDALLKYLEGSAKPYIIATFGIGHDCHTASIFPKTTKKEFNDLYATSASYIAVSEPNNEYHKRTTITPEFIKSKIDEIIIFAAGKQETLFTLQYAKSANQCPALLLTEQDNYTLFTDAEITGL